MRQASASRTGNLTKPVFKHRAARFLRWRKKHPRRGDRRQLELPFDEPTD
jgi:hypothetical protein